MKKKSWRETDKPGVRTERPTGLRKEERKPVLGSVDKETELRWENQKMTGRQDRGQQRETVLRARASDRTDGKRERGWDSKKHCPTLCITAEERDKASEHRRVQQGVWLLYCKILGHASVHMRERVCERQTHLCFSPGSSSISVSHGL